MERWPGTCHAHYIGIDYSGAGYRFNFGLELTLNYNAGLLGVLKEIETSKYRPSVFQFTVRYDVFRFGAK